MTRRQNPGKKIEAGGEVVAVMRNSGPGVERHPHGQRIYAAPWFSNQLSLRCHRCGDSILCRLKCCLDCVADDLEERAMVDLDGIAKQIQVTIYGTLHLPRMAFP